MAAREQMAPGTSAAEHGFIGVRWHKNYNKFQSIVTLRRAEVPSLPRSLRGSGKRVHLTGGLYTTAAEAAHATDK